MKRISKTGLRFGIAGCIMYEMSQREIFHSEYDIVEYHIVICIYDEAMMEKSSARKALQRVFGWCENISGSYEYIPEQRPEHPE